MPSDTITAVERKVICVILNDMEALVPVADVLPEPRFFQDERCAAAYRAVQDIAKSGVPATMPGVAEHLGWPLPAVQDLAIGYSTKDAREVVYLAEMIAREGQRRLLQQALREAAELADQPTEDVAGLAMWTMNMIAGTSAEIGGRRDSGVASIESEMDTVLASIERRSGILGLPTRFDWFNDKTFGLCPATIWILSGPYKAGRKSTMMRNLTIDACRAGGSVDIFALEGDRVSTYAGLLAMLATERLLKWRLTDECILSDTFILRGIRTEMQSAAIAEARAELRAFNLRIYDGRDGIGDAGRIGVKVRRDKMLAGLQVFFVDYLQLIGSANAKLFDRVEASSHAMQRLAVEQEVCAVLIAQMPESAIWQLKEGESDGSYAGGIKGGGDPAAAADYLFRSMVSQSDPTLLNVELKLARHARPGKIRLVLNEQSGWVIRQQIA